MSQEISKSAEVDAFLESCQHPAIAVIQEIREVILASSPDVSEGIKWNSMSFRSFEWFATLNQRELKQIQFIFHLGAKRREGVNKSSFYDPDGFLEWKGSDRCIVTFKDEKQARERMNWFREFVEEWVKWV